MILGAAEEALVKVGVVADAEEAQALVCGAEVGGGGELVTLADEDSIWLPITWLEVFREDWRACGRGLFVDF